ncbi:MAG: hypothetical protein L3J79_00250, partial [Candidatus Marinimicrobia bacterium]|nr:hypothetical protein [Candidatus Neomarinimicrobiota bacterium]
MRQQYSSYNECIDFFKAAAKKHPDLFRIETIGTTWEERDIIAVTVSKGMQEADSKPALFYTGTIHAREWIGIELSIAFAQYVLDHIQYDPLLNHLLERATFYMVPCANPDGFEYSRTHFSFWRKNRRQNADGSFGVDLNRNFSIGFAPNKNTSSNVYPGPSAFSEPETQALKAFAEDHPNITIALDYHSQGNVFFPAHSFIHEDVVSTTDLNVLAANMAEEIRRVSGREYGVHMGKPPTALISGSGREFYYSQGALALVVEVGTRNISDYQEDMTEHIHEHISALGKALSEVPNYAKKDGLPRVGSFIATDVNAKETTLSWEYPLTENIYFEIYRSDKSNGFCRGDNRIGMTRSHSFTDRQIEPNTNYYYFVRAVIKRGKRHIKSPYAPVVGIRTQPELSMFSKILYPRKEDVGYVGELTLKNKEHFGVNSLFVGISETKGVCFGITSFSLETVPENAIITDARISFFPMNRVLVQVERYGEWRVGMIDERTVETLSSYDDIKQATLLGYIDQPSGSHQLSQGIWHSYAFAEQERQLLQEALKRRKATFRMEGPKSLPMNRTSQLMQWDIGFGKYSSGLTYRPKLEISYTLPDARLELQSSSTITISRAGLDRSILDVGYDAKGDRLYGCIAFDTIQMPDMENTVISEAYLVLHADAVSAEVLEGNGELRFRFPIMANYYAAIGFNASNDSQHYNDLDYYIGVDTGQGEIWIGDGGASAGYFGSYVASDEFAIERQGTTVTFKKNGIIIYTSTVPSSGSLVADTSMLNPNGTIGQILGFGFELPATGDFDGDGLANQWEVDNGLNPYVAGTDASADLDADGLDNAGEFSAGTDPNDFDSDNDGLSDGVEVNTYATNPLSEDTDGDGLGDAWEVANGLDPLVVGTDATDDEDADGLSNLAEFTAGTDPNLADTDADGLTDGAEVNTYATDPLNVDTDGDGLPDGWEVNYGFDPLVAGTDATDDVDSDGRSNLQEFQDGTDPQDGNNFLSWKNVVFTDFVGVTATDITSIGTSLEKTGTVAGGNADAVSAALLAGDGEVRFRFTNPLLDDMMMGLNGMNHGQSYTDLDYAIFAKLGLIRIYEEGVDRGDFGSYVASDIFSIERIGIVINYKKNGVVFYVSEVSSSGLLMVDNALWTPGNVVDRIQAIGFALPVAGDFDEDGLTNQWESDNGLDPYTAGTDAADDPDDDGLSNWEEYAGGSDPQDASDPVSGGQVWEDLRFQNLVGTSVEGESGLGSSIKKIWVTAGWNADGVSAELLTGDGEVRFRFPRTDKHVFLGLNIVNTGRGYGELDYSIHGQGGGALIIYQNGTKVGNFGTYSISDVYSISRTGATISYKRNGAVFYTSVITNSGALMVDGSFHSLGTEVDRIQGVGFALPVAGDFDEDGLANQWESDNGLDPYTAGTDAADDLDGDGSTNLQEFQDGTDPLDADNLYEEVVWKDLVNTTTTAGVAGEGSTLTKTDGVDGNWDSDGVSTKTIAGDGGVKFKISPTNKAVYIGLALSNADRDNNHLEYSIKGTSTATIRVVELGVEKLNNGNFSASDIFEIKRTGTVVTYLKNGLVIYTSTVPSSGDLLVDTSFRHIGASLNSVRYTGTSIDTDDDDLSDDWEIAHFGDIVSYDGSDDPDGDGLDNLAELTAGTDPNLADTD